MRRRTSARIASEDNAPVLPAGAAVEKLWVAYPPDWCSRLAGVVPLARPEPVYAGFRTLDASVQPLLATVEQLSKQPVKTAC